MLLAIPFPPLAPEIFTIAFGGVNFALRWYALAYIAGLLIGWWIVASLMRRAHLWLGETPPMTVPQVEALLTWVILGVVLGGRLGYVAFYQPDYYLANPAEILMVWQGGMSFHGGFLGVVVAGLLYCWAIKAPILPVADALAVAAPIGLMLGRIANFINAELWGRPTDVAWGVIFPGPAAQDCGAAITGLCARHPSQLYEAALEGLFLALVLFWLAYRRGALMRPGLMTGLFLAGYGAARAFVELYRQPDAQFVTETNPLGHAYFLGEVGLTMGQVLSLPMVALGLGLILGSYLRRAR
ncbi:MAG: phosphatidylglycerol:prolipoprotein diacylglycerol transferase [Sulfitobacter sp.]|jgi:phosphatidylglycerol:prolipoprotein diacylglycerol transferase